MSDDEAVETGEMEWPRSVAAAVEHLMRTMPADAKCTLRAISEDQLVMAHFGLGLWICNHYGLLEGNTELLEDACEDGLPCDPDGASARITRALWLRLRSQS